MLVWVLLRTELSRARFETARRLCAYSLGEQISS